MISHSIDVLSNGVSLAIQHTPTLTAAGLVLAAGFAALYVSRHKKDYALLMGVSLVYALAPFAPWAVWSMM